MTRRTFIALSSATLASVTLDPGALARPAKSIDADWYRRSRRFASLPMGRVAYVENGHGPAALFLHGFPLNGFQWRGSLERLHTVRRCIAPDLMSMGYSEIPESQPINPHSQVQMLVALLDSLKVKDVDLVANDSGGLVAQLFIAEHPRRVRTLLLTNCDVDQNNPPALFLPAVALARKGLFAERFVVPQLQDKQMARSEKGLGLAYTFPDRLSDETIEFYLRPLVSSRARKVQVDQYTESLGENLLAAITPRLQQWNGPARMVWALQDKFFAVEWAEWLNRTLPGSRGVRRLEQANLFFPEEMPDVIAEEAKQLWK
jgi:haloalkane dehalogenase